MPSTYGEVPLLLPDNDKTLDAWMNQWQSLSDLCLIAPDTVARSSGRNRARHAHLNSVPLPVPNWDQRPPRWKINSLWWPSTGASRFAIGLFLVDEDSLQEIRDKYYDGPLNLVLGEGETGYKQGLSTAMYMLPPRRISAEVAVRDGLFLLPLVDRRYSWQNISAGNLTLGQLTGTHGTVAAACMTALGGTADGDLDGYSAADWVELSRKGVNAAMLLDAVCFSCNRRFVAGINGASYRYEKASDAKDVVDANLEDDPKRLLMGGSVAEADLLLTKPKTLVGTFPRRQGGIVQGNGAVWQSSAQIDADGKGGKKDVLSTLQADFSQRGATPNNAGELASLAAVMASDSGGWFDRQYDATYLGLKAWSPNGFDNWAWWHYGGRGSNGEYEAHCRAVSLPPDTGAEFNLSQSSSSPKTFIGCPIFRVKLTTDWNNEYSELDGISPVPYRATAKIYYLDGSAFTEDSTEVYVYDTLNLRGESTTGSKLWVSALAHDTNRFEVVTGQLGNDLVFFELYEDLNLGSTATANILDSAAGAFEDPEPGDQLIIVRDPYNEGMWQGYAGYRGFARRHPTQDPEAEFETYDIVFMEEIARWIYYVLNEDLPAGADVSAEANVLDYHDGHIPEETLQVYTPKIGMDYYSGWHVTGCQGWAHWNDFQRRYEITTPQLHVAFMRGELYGPVCSDESNFLVTDLSPIRQGMHSYFPNDLPDPLTVLNPRGHIGSAGREVVLMGTQNEAGDGLTWEIVDMQVVDAQFVTQIAYDSLNCRITAPTLAVRVETCGTAGTTSTLTMTAKKFVTKLEHVVDMDSEEPQCELVQTTQTFCVFEKTNELGFTDETTTSLIAFTAQPVITDIDLNVEEGYLDYNVCVVFTPCTKPCEDVHGIEIGPCQEPPA